jgi:hypothetical protein
VKFWLGVLATFLVISPIAETVTEYETFVRTVHLAPERASTPIADSLVDWDRLEAESDCLWEFLQTHGVELTLQTVLAAGDWTDALGGACLVMGEDDEEQG